MIPFFEELLNRFRELHAGLADRVTELPQEVLDWNPGPEMNSIGILVAHIAGAERYLIGDVVLEDPSHRDRPAEFLTKGLSGPELSRRLKASEDYMMRAFETLALDDLGKTRRFPRDGRQVKVSWSLLHALEHTANHVGHIELILQFWEQRASTRTG